MLTLQGTKGTASPAELASHPGPRFDATDSLPNKLRAAVSPTSWANADVTSGSNDSHDATGMVTTSGHSDHPVDPCAGGILADQRQTNSVGSRSGGSQCSAESTRERTKAHNQRKRAASPGATSPGPAARPRSATKGPCLSAERPPDAWAQVGRTKASPNKKARMTWDADLHREFLKALSTLGLRHAVPKTIMQACTDAICLVSGAHMSCTPVFDLCCLRLLQALPVSRLLCTLLCNYLLSC